MTTHVQMTLRAYLTAVTWGGGRTGALAPSSMV